MCPLCRAVSVVCPLCRAVSGVSAVPGRVRGVSGVSAVPCPVFPRCPLAGMGAGSDPVSVCLCVWWWWGGGSESGSHDVTSAVTAAATPPPHAAAPAGFSVVRTAECRSGLPYAASPAHQEAPLVAVLMLDTYCSRCLELIGIRYLPTPDVNSDVLD